MAMEFFKMDFGPAILLKTESSKKCEREAVQ